MKFSIHNISLILFVFLTVSYSQDNWELLIPSTTSNQMASLYFIDEINGWSVGNYGTITKTIDGGLTWELVEIEYLTDLTDVYFPTAFVGYIVGENGLILKTSNGGGTWAKLDNDLSNNLYRIKFRDTENGWAIGEKGLILHTTDGGGTWNQQTSGVGYLLSGIDFIDDQNTCIVGSNNVILITEDEGDTWQLIENEFTFYDNVIYPLSFTDVYFVNDTSGYACGNYGEGGYIALTIDAGESWRLKATREAKYIDLRGASSTGWSLYPNQQIYFKDDLKTGLCLVSGSSQQGGNFPLYTKNEGHTLKAFIDGYDEGYFGKARFQFLNDSSVIITGYHGDIRFSDDSGQNWYFKNTDHRFWEDFKIGPDNTLHALRRKPIRGTSDYDYKHFISKDKGTTWSEVISTIDYLDGSYEEINTVTSFNMKDFGCFTLTSDPRLFIIHRRNTTDTTMSILYSEDMGITYHELRGGVRNVLATNIQFLTPDTIISTDISVEGRTFTCAVSYDGGVTFLWNRFDGVWNNLGHSVWNPAQIKDSYYLDSHTGFVVGDDGNILKTEDAGQSWENIYSGVIETLWDIEFINPDIGFAVGEFGRILITEDGGARWRKTNSGTQEDIYSIAFLNESKGWVGTESGLRYTTDGGETWHGVPMRYQHGAVHNIKFDQHGNAYAYTLCNDINHDWETSNEHSGSYVLLQRMTDYSTRIHEYKKINQPYPEQVSLYPNYPNPFNSTTRIEYYLPRSGFVSIKIFNIQGQLIRILMNQSQKSGRYYTVWNGYTDSGISVSSGVYIYQLKYKNQIKNSKLLLVK